jgi:glycerol-1-phosphate dehydrogenase [NAD(P)+]
LPEFANAAVEETIKVTPRITWIKAGDLFAGAQSALREAAPHIVILHGQQYSKQIAERVCEAYRILPAQRLPSVGDASEESAQVLLHSPAVRHCDVILAIGGGSVQDTAKYVAAQANKQLIVMPTLVATDGIASPVAVLHGPDGRTVSHGAVAPREVLLYWPLFEAVPTVYWQALVGDVIGNFVAVRDVRRFAAPHESMQARKTLELGCKKAEAAAQNILAFEQPDLAHKAFKTLLVDSAILSSSAMLESGSSQPCSGAEHLLSHAIDFLRIPPGWLHGQQVGAAVPFCLSLHDEKQLQDEVVQLYVRLGMPASLQALGPAIEQNSESILRLAPQMRVGRRTILGQYSTNELLQRFSLK